MTDTALLSSMVHDLAKECATLGKKLAALQARDPGDGLDPLPPDCKEVVIVAFEQLREGKGREVTSD